MASRVLRRELLNSAKRYDALLGAKVEGLGATSFRAREVERFKRYTPGAGEPLATGSWRARMSADGGEEQLTALLDCGFPDPDKSAEWSEDTVERGFAALRMVNRRLTAMQDDGDNWVATKPAEITFDIGNVYRHRKYGFRGVILQWFSQCPAGDEWLEEWGPFKDGTKQPFYRTLVDIKDRPEPLMTLAAEENLEYLPYESTPVEHPKVEEVFVDFSLGHFELKESLADIFREDW